MATDDSSPCGQEKNCLNKGLFSLPGIIAEGMLAIEYRQKLALLWGSQMIRHSMDALCELCAYSDFFV